MKTTKFILFILILLVSCTNDDWKDEVDSLKKELEAQRKLIELLQAEIKITSIEVESDVAVITFSNGSVITVKDKQIPIIHLGKNGNWFINGQDTTIPFKGDADEIPIIEIGVDGNWYIDGKNTNIPANGRKSENKNDIPSIISIIEISSRFIFNFSDGSSITATKDKILIVTWGDSLTASGKYQSAISSIVGNNFTIINRGIGGESVREIAARQGGVPLCLATNVILPGDGSNTLIGSKNNAFVNVLGGLCTPLLQGDKLNPVYINNIECTLSWNSEKNEYYIKRNNSSDKDVLLPEKTLIFPTDAKLYRNPHAAIFWIGQNGGWNNDPEELIDYYEQMIRFSGCGSNYTIIGLHSGNKEERRNLEETFIKKFGLNYINWREYCVVSALDDAGIIPTAKDIAAIEVGECPPSLLQDHVHHNNIGYELLGKLIVKRFKQLGIL